MNTPEVTFRTAFFQPVPGEENETNPGIYGKALATWFAENLKARNSPFEEVIPEDWGWVVLVQRKPFMLWVGCGNTDGSRDEWRAFPIAERTLLQRMLGREKMGAKLGVEMLTIWLKNTVPTIPGVSEISWS